MIKAPRLPLSHPDIYNECEKALRGEFRRLIADAAAAGWPASMVVGALESLALQTLLEVLDSKKPGGLHL